MRNNSAVMGGPFLASSPGLSENPHEAPQCPGYHNCPENNNPNNILDLFPPGLTLVATFPQFSRFSSKCGFRGCDLERASSELLVN